MQHRTVRVPDIGDLDHAWDVLGAWEAELELLDQNDRVPGELAFVSWDEAELRLDSERAKAMGLPPRVRLSRETEIERSDAGGGALEWSMAAAEAPWALQCVLWPGELFSRVGHAGRNEELYRLKAKRPPAYYAAKYP
jgi:hypothetical protein